MAGDRSSLDSEQNLTAILKAGVSCIAARSDSKGLAAQVCLQSRQETAAAVDYRKRARALKPDCSFVEQPIPDQEAGTGPRVGFLARSRRMKWYWSSSSS